MRRLRRLSSSLVVLAAICLGLGIQNTVQACSVAEARSLVPFFGVPLNEVLLSYTLTLEAGEHLDPDDVLLIRFEPDPNSRPDIFGDLRTTPFDFLDETPVCNFDGPVCATNYFTRGYFPDEFVNDHLPILAIPPDDHVVIFSTFSGGQVTQRVQLGFFFMDFIAATSAPPFAQIIFHSATIYSVDGTVHHQCGAGLSEDGNGATP